MFIDADTHYAHENIFNTIDNQTWLDQYHKNNHKLFSQSIEKFHSNIDHRSNIDRQLLNVYGPSIGLMYDVEPVFAAEIMQTYNDGMIALCKQHSKFNCTIWLALQNIEQSLDEIDKATDTSVFAVHLGDQIPWGFLTDLDPVFAKLEQNKIPIYLHFANSFDIAPGWVTLLENNGQYQKLKQHWPVYSDAWKVALSSILVSGLLDRYPDLRIVVAERGINWVQELQSYVLSEFGISSEKYFQHNLWFTTEVEVNSFINDANQLGWDRLLFATDWPHDDDAGGINSRLDATMTDEFLSTGQISKENYDLFTHKNYLKLHTRA
jgi:predicted TIM-barrel fold metal-dependent hydrolase